MPNVFASLRFDGRAGGAVLLLAITVLPLGALLTGCGPSRVATQQEDPTIDSLRAENMRLRESKATLQDSLQFYSDIETGRYYRTLRVLRDQFGRLRYDATLLREGGRTVEVISADQLFEPASARLTDAGRVRLDTLVARQLQDLAPERRLRVEGHADGAALSAELQKTYPSNWALSAFRAATVVHYLIEAHNLSADRFEVAAFSDTRPIASNETAAGRRRNRRVRIAVLPRERAYAQPDSDVW